MSSSPQPTPRFAVIAIMATLVTSTLLAAGAPAGATLDPGRWAMKRETNQSRIEHNIRRVFLRDRLSDIARRHSARMARRGELFHTANAAGTYLDGISWSTWGENVGYTSQTLRRLQRLFMRSPSHRANILNPRFRHVAIGTVRRGGILWVTVFFYG